MPRGVASGQADQRADLGDRLGAGRLRRRRGGRVRADAARARLRHRRRVLGAGHAARATGVSAAATRPRSPTGSATRSGSRRSPSARSRRTTTSTRSSPRARRLCALARPHLYDPRWTLHAAAEQGYDGVTWPAQCQAGSRRPPAGRDGAQGASRMFEPAARAAIRVVALSRAPDRSPPAAVRPRTRRHAARHVRAAVRRRVWSGGLVVLLAEFGFSHGAPAWR